MRGRTYCRASSGDWECEADGELNVWTKLLAARLPELRTEAVNLGAIPGDPTELLKAVEHIRHLAVHRERRFAQTTAALLAKGGTLLRMLRDHERAAQLDELVRELERSIRQGAATAQLERILPGGPSPTPALALAPAPAPARALAPAPRTTATPALPQPPVQMVSVIKGDIVEARIGHDVYELR